MAAPLTALGDRTFGSLRRHRNYRLYFAGSGISFIGTWMQQIAAYWLVLDLTDSAVAVGALALVQTLPVTALALVGGSIADRVDLRRMVVSCETVMGIQAGVLCVLALTGLIATWQLYVLGLVQGVAVALNGPARHTLVFQIVGRDDLTNAIALSASLGTTARILGPAVGGVVVAAFGPGVAFGLNAVELHDRDLRPARDATRTEARAHGAAVRRHGRHRAVVPVRGQLAARRRHVLHAPPRLHLRVQLRRAPAPPGAADARPGATGRSA